MMDFTTIAATAMPSTGEVLRAVISYSMKASLVLAAAAGLALIMRRSSAAARHGLWVIAFSALLLLPLFNFSLPPIDLPLLPADLLGPEEGTELDPATGPVEIDKSRQRQFLFTGRPFAGFYPLSGISGTRIGIEEIKIHAGPKSGKANTWYSAALSGWALGMLIVSVLFIANRIKVHVLARRSVPADDAWSRRADRISAGLGIRRKIRYRVCRGISAPLTFGFIRPVILLPENYELWTVETGRIVLLQPRVFQTLRSFSDTSNFRAISHKESPLRTL